MVAPPEDYVVPPCLTVEYASIFRFKGKTYLFYNGDNCDETGFGYPILKQ